MATIDDKVVAMSFESSKFEQGVSRSITALDRLKAALAFPNAAKGLDDVNAAAQNNQLGLIGRAVDAILPKLETLRLVAIGVMSQITTKAVIAGSQLVKSLTLDPIIQGFHEYTTNLNAVQTILANTAAAGTTLDDVNKALNTLNQYSDKTIYNFSQMARNIGTFTAAGVDLDTSTAAIKGIANLAALSGSNADQASTAMYQLSQALSAGRVTLMDWNSVVNAGMGGTVFQRALAQTAEKMGTLDEGAVKLTGKMKNVTIAGESFRNSLSAAPGEESWLTSDVLTKTLSQFTGDLSDAELAAQGFNKEEIKAIQNQAKLAQEAATQVKTLGQLLDTTKEAIGSGWAQTWQIIFGDFKEARELFSGISDAIGGFIQSNAEARNSVLQAWKDLGGRTDLIEALKNVFNALGDIVGAVSDAFREIFPAKTGADLALLTRNFRDFTETLKPSPETLDNLKRTFAGLFAILDIGKQILGGIFDVFRRVIGAVAGGSGSFLGFTGTIGDFLVHIDDLLKAGDGIEKVFTTIGDVLVVPVKMIGQLKDAIGELFDSIGGGDGGGGASAFQNLFQGITEVWLNFLDSFSSAGKILKPIIESYINLFTVLVDGIANAFANMNFEAILEVIRTGLLGGLVLMLRNFLGKGSFVTQLTRGFSGLGGGILANISGSFKALQGSMVALQQNIKAKTLKEIAIAVALLAASVLALSLVDPKRLKSALGAMTVAFAELLGAMAILGNITKTMGFIKIPVIAASMILLAGALALLSVSVLMLSQLDWNDLLKGLTGVGTLLGIIAAASIPLSANASGMIRAGTGITAIATGLLILSFAVKTMAGLSWGEMVKGLIGIGVGLGILVVATAFIPAGGMVGIGAGLLLVATALKVLASAVSDFGDLDFSTMGKGMLGIGAALVIIAGAMRLMPGNMILTAAGLLLVSVALGQIADVVGQMGGMSMGEIAKGLGTLAGALIILGVALYAMQGTIGGAVALGIAAAGILVLSSALEALGGMSWQQIVTALVALAAAFAVIGVAGALITGALPGLLGLGAALLLIGAGLALAGVGISLIAAGISALVVAIPTGIGIILESINEFRDALIDAAKNLIIGLIEIADALADTAPKFVDALIRILNSVVDGIIELMPKLIELTEVLIDALVQILDDNQDKIIQAGFNLLIALLEGIRNNIGQLVDLATEIIIAFAEGIARNAQEIASAGVDILIKFINGIVNNLGKLAALGPDIIAKLIRGIANNFSKMLSAGTDAMVKFLTGIGNAAPRIIRAGVDAATKFVTALSNQVPKLADKGATALINFMNRMADVIEHRTPELMAAVTRIGVAIVTGIAQGIIDSGGVIIDAIVDKFPFFLRAAARKALGISSPSKLTYEWGVFLVEGLVKGIEDNAQNAAVAVTDTARGMLASINRVSFDDAINLNPTITPILDLTQVRGQAKELQGLTDIAPTTTVALASSISPVPPDELAAAVMRGPSVDFTQNNYSPKALTSVEIYRQTRNQLSQVKSALAVT